MNGGVTSSKDLKSLRDSSDYPVHNQPLPVDKGGKVGENL